MALDQTYRDIASGTMLGFYGETVTYSRSGASDIELTAIFNERFERTEINGAEVDVIVSTPAFDFRIADIGSKPRNGDTVTRASGDSYTIYDWQPDGEGGVLCFCEKVTE